MSKKIVSKVAPVVTESATPATVASVNPVPATVSAPPAGWVEPAKLGRKGRRPKNGLTLDASELAAELRKNAARLLQELGPKAVDPQQLAAALDTANAWEGVDAKAATFRTYSRAQRGSAWDAAVALMGGMRLGVKFALSRDATFADRFPGVAKAFAVQKRSKKSASKKGTTAVATESPATPEPQAAAPETAPKA